MRWRKGHAPPKELCLKALMEQGGEAEYVTGVRAVKARTDPSARSGQWEVQYEWVYDEKEKGTNVALLELESSTDRLLLKSWNWSAAKANTGFQRQFANTEIDVS